MRIQIFPKGYDPMVASGPVTPDIEKLGITWTPQETQRMQLVRQQAEVIEVKERYEDGIKKPIVPINRWYSVID